MRWYIFICLFVLAYCKNGPEVEIKDGKLQGKYMMTKNGRKISGFLGIPYAKPPINELRFKDPEPADPWTGLRSAMKDSPMCVQNNIYIKSTIVEGVEDCLYLNVYTPQLPNKHSNLLPVMVWFHGGGWITGDGTSFLYGPGRLLDRDIVLVSFNYRLSVLGFLSTQDDVVFGNMGMKDQVLVLKWVQENIAKFGGDPNSVTIFGESVGGANVHYHMLSPLSKGLFHKVIAQSGTSLSPWSFTSERSAKLIAQKLADSLNCPITDTKQMVECLRKVDAHTIVGQQQIFLEWDNEPVILFSPVVEHKHPNAFLTENPHKIYKSGQVYQVPFIAGLTSSEGAFRVAGLYGEPKYLKELEENIDDILPMSLGYRDTLSDVQVITNKIKEFYFKDKKIGNDTIKELSNMYMDAWLTEGFAKTAKQHLNVIKTPTYLYYFNYRGTFSYSALFGDPHRDYGVCHSDDLLYLFPVADSLFPGKSHSETDNRVAEIMTTMWANFARTGNPSYKNVVDWKPMTSEAMEILHIKNDKYMKMEKNILEERIDFWMNLPLKKDDKFEKQEL